MARQKFLCSKSGILARVGFVNYYQNIYWTPKGGFTGRLCLFHFFSLNTHFVSQCQTCRRGGVLSERRNCIQINKHEPPVWFLDDGNMFVFRSPSKCFLRTKMNNSHYTT